MRKLVFFLILIIFLGLLGWFLLKDKTAETMLSPELNAPTVTTKDTPIDFTAEFEIITNGTRRTFTNSMYHNQSDDVYIESSSPNTIRVKKAGITWDNFFKTLPFSLSKDCLTTGTGQTFCTNENQTLRFILNGIETPNALNEIINPNDRLEVIY
jgi:hypothetical protein